MSNSSNSFSCEEGTNKTRDHETLYKQLYLRIPHSISTETKDSDLLSYSLYTQKMFKRTKPLCWGDDQALAQLLPLAQVDLLTTCVDIKNNELSPSMKRLFVESIKRFKQSCKATYKHSKWVR